MTSSLPNPPGYSATRKWKFSPALKIDKLLKLEKNDKYELLKTSSVYAKGREFLVVEWLGFVSQYVITYLRCAPVNDL